MKILAVDDDAFILELLGLFTAKVGFPNVTKAASGPEALALLNESSNGYDCILLDISMPEMDGIELCGRIRAMPAYSKTPIIMLTAMREKSYVDGAFKAGATDYLTKPLDVTELGARLRVIAELVAARRSVQALTHDTVTLASNTPAIPLEREIPIEGVPGLIEYTALGNYILQLSDSGLGTAQVVAAKINDIEEIYEKASPAEFQQLIATIAAALSAVFREFEGALAYSGNGVFLVMFYKESMEPSAGLERTLQLLIDKKGLKYVDGTQLDAIVTIGNPIRPNPGKARRISKTFDRAVARAESRMSKRAASD
ncbi:response regulator [Pararhodobacter zhoushanensis]|uniref:response regulator n=1 Tax=Pararhodobacter zhoushanensis TaxID=2479545 RepID=UPI000F8CF29F|nr:response regulator [Pararhodobacter zhoushanensis]